MIRDARCGLSALVISICLTSPLVPRDARAVDPNEFWGSLGAGHWTDGRVISLLDWRGYLIAAGEFTMAGGKPALNIARWDGVEWHRLGDGVGWAAQSGAILAMAEYQGDLIVGGGFYGAGDDASIVHLARWDGHVWSDLGSELDPFRPSVIRSMTVFQNDLIVGGDFSRIGQRGARRVGRYNGGWRPMGQGFNSAPRAFQAQGTTLIAGGPFTDADGLPRAKVARWVDGRWDAMGDGFQVDTALPATVFALAEYNGDIIAAGYFRSSGATPIRGIARWNGQAWEPLPGGGIDSRDSQFWAWSLTVYRDELYVGGKIDSAGSIQVNDVARWDGMEWRDLGSGVGSFVRDLMTYDDRLFVAGDFKMVGAGQTAHFLGTWTNGPLSIDPDEPGVDRPGAIPQVALLPNQPNPFNPATTIRFSTERDGSVSLRIVDLRGQLVRTLTRAMYPAGQHELRWDGRDGSGLPVASGVYLVHLNANQQRRASKMTLVR